MRSFRANPGCGSRARCASRLTTSRSPTLCSCARADSYRTGHPTAADVLLLVEVTDGSLALDRGPKPALYARYGVPVVWIVDLVGRAVELCRGPGPEGYAERHQVTEGMAMPTLVPGLEIDVAALLA